MTQKIYSFSGMENGYGSLSNMLSYRPAMSTQYTYMLTTLNPYSPEVGDKVITGKYSGTEVKMDGVEYTIVRQSDILAIVE